MNPTTIVNVLSAIAGILAVFGVNLHLDNATITQLAGGIIAALAVVNAVVHYVRDRQVVTPVTPPASDALAHLVRAEVTRQTAKPKKSRGFASLPILLALIVLVLLSGCAGLLGQQNLSAEQLKAAALDKNASVACGTGTGPWGKVNTVYVNVDKAAVTNGTVTVDGECKVSIATSQKPVVVAP